MRLDEKANRKAQDTRMRKPLPEETPGGNRTETYYNPSHIPHLNEEFAARQEETQETTRDTRCKCRPQFLHEAGSENEGSGG
jgi:hypothetical protein